jgi:cell division septation protein DedD
MATATQDDGFHEIQLNGKQLVFLFMAVTVVLVVTFLCGVLVGRDLQFNRGGPTAVDTIAGGTDDDVAPAPPASADIPGASSGPVAAKEDLTYTDILGNDKRPGEKLRSPGEPAPPPAKSEPVAAEPSAPTPDPTPASAPARAAVPAAPAEPRGAGLAIQVTAVKERADADQIANRLIGKGYKAYVVAPAAGTPAVYRVRIGKFKEQREADSVAARLRKEEQFDPWIVR